VDTGALTGALICTRIVSLLKQMNKASQRMDKLTTQDEPESNHWNRM